MRALSLVALIATLASAGASADERTNAADAAMVRAGHNIAVTSCVACHTVTPKQAVAPVLGPGIPSFEEIANRPDVTAQSLQSAMKTARWHDKAMAGTLLPMSRISDKEQGQVAAFIVSLRKSR
ncbi:MAG TPA: c-type cytochrome [Micropepsaceae bacterium]|jgi:mono/diheme cytochrome c family protein|nr:c-type cytochrome [Micropepsaceae bacterium]